jgi:hypothetical protein
LRGGLSGAAVPLVETVFFGREVVLYCTRLWFRRELSSVSDGAGVQFLKRSFVAETLMVAGGDLIKMPVAAVM